MSVRLSVRLSITQYNTRDPRLNASLYRSAFCTYGRSAWHREPQYYNV